jgi:hypothetical protein
MHVQMHVWKRHCCGHLPSSAACGQLVAAVDDAGQVVSEDGAVQVQVDCSAGSSWRDAALAGMARGGTAGRASARPSAAILRRRDRTYQEHGAAGHAGACDDGQGDEHDVQ